MQKHKLSEYLPRTLGLFFEHGHPVVGFGVPVLAQDHESGLFGVVDEVDEDVLLAEDGIVDFGEIVVWKHAHGRCVDDEVTLAQHLIGERVVGVVAFVGTPADCRERYLFLSQHILDGF